MHPILNRASLLRQDDRKQLIVLLQEVEEARIPLLRIRVHVEVSRCAHALHKQRLHRPRRARALRQRTQQQMRHTQPQSMPALGTSIAKGQALIYDRPLPRAITKTDDFCCETSRGRADRATLSVGLPSLCSASLVNVGDVLGRVRGAAARFSKQRRIRGLRS